MSLREALSDSIVFTVINKYGKRAVVQNLTEFPAVYHDALEGFTEVGLFGHLSNNVLRSP